MAKLIMPGDTDAAGAGGKLSVAQGVANFDELSRRIQASAPNLDPSAGRFIQPEFRAYAYDNAIEFTNLAVSPTNGATIVEHARHLNGTFPSAENDDLSDLLTSVGIDDNAGKAVGAFYIARVTAGTETTRQNSHVNGTYRSLVNAPECRGWICQENKLGTHGMFLRKKSGTLAVQGYNPNIALDVYKHRDIRIDGISVASGTGGGGIGHEITGTDWVYYERTIETGYDHVWDLGIDASAGAEFLVAWPEFTTLGYCKDFVPKGPRA